MKRIRRARLALTKFPKNHRVAGVVSAAIENEERFERNELER
jgi:hypothetical protein